MKNFKYALLIILSIALFSQCTKEEPKPSPEIDYSGETISIAEIFNFVPEYLLKKSTIIYKNASGEEITLKSTYNTQISEGKIGDVEYSTETFETRLYSESNILLNITLKASGIVWTDGTVSKSLIVMLMPFHPGGNLFLDISFEDGEVTKELFSPSEIPTIELLGKSFARVFKQKKMEDSDTFSEIFFSPIGGVIAYRDEHNDLWVLDEVIE